MHVALVKPCWRYPIEQADNTYNRRWPPLELLNCGAILRAAGHQVVLVDAQAESLPPERVAQRVGGAELAVVTSSALDRWQCPTFALGPVRAVVEALRPRVGAIALCGYHGTVHPEPMLALVGADVVVRGEPEWTIEELAAGRPWREIAGLTFRHRGETVHTADRPPLDLTRLPPPALELIDPRRYAYEILGGRFVVLEGSRGCSCGCTFCSRAIQGRRRREKGVDQLTREIELAVGLGARNAYFIDLEFTASRGFVESLCGALIERKLPLRWCCQTRTDQVDEPLLRLMRRAGCRLVHFGIETADAVLARSLRKPIAMQTHEAAVRAARRAGVDTLCFFLLGFPGETEAQMRATIRAALRLGPTYASFHRVAPYPGTVLHEQWIARSTASATASPIASATDTADSADRTDSAAERAASEPGDASVEPSEAPSLPVIEAPAVGDLFPEFAGTPARREAVDRLVREAFRAFYLRPRYILSRLVRSTPRDWCRQLRLFTGYVR